MKTAPNLFGTNGIIQISDDTVVKICESFNSARAESLAIDLVHAETLIPIPHVRRIIPRPFRRKGYDLIVMDLIPNAKQLHTCWDSLSFLAKLKVVLTMRYYLKQLRGIQAAPLAPPGPLYPQPAKCCCLLFGCDEGGPFPTTMALARYFHEMLITAEDNFLRGLIPAPRCRPLDGSIFAPLVFAHNSLDMRHILLDDDGVLWIVGWNWAGFYPTWFEYVGMRLAARASLEPSSWKRAINFVVEPSFKMERWMKCIACGCS